MTLKVYPLQPDLIHQFEPGNAWTLKAWCNNTQSLSAATHFGYVYQGHPTIYRNSGAESYRLHPGMYFCLPEAGRLDGLNSSGIIITCSGYRGMFNIGGAIESQGRFAYIDGGTNSLLIPPIGLGDPCLNAMYLPPDVDQTWHTHPSDRLGIVVKGSGTVKTNQKCDDLIPGSVFAIQADCLHKFCTYSKELVLVVFHPDSDAGFTDQDNLMLRRTVVDGVSAVNLPQIHTKIHSDSEQSTK